MHGKFLNFKIIKTNLPPEELLCLPEVTNAILERIYSGETSWDEIDAFLNWFFSLPKTNRQVLLQDFEPKKGSVIRCISAEKNLVLSPVNGSKEISDAYAVFAAIDDDFRLYNLENSKATPITPVSVYEIVKPSTLKEVFGSLPLEFDQLCFTQHQILNFVTRFRPWLSKGYPTFFPFKSHDKQYVVGVEDTGKSELHVFLHHLHFTMVFGGNWKARLVMPRFEQKE